PGLSGSGGHAHSLDERVRFRDLTVDLVAVVEVVRQRGIDIRKTEVRISGRDLVGRHTLLRPADDVLDADASSLDPRLTAADAGRAFDMRVQGRFLRAMWTSFRSPPL